MNTKNFTKNQKRLLELCYHSIRHSDDKLIEKAIYKNIDIDETCDVPQSIRTIECYNSAISNTIEVNGKNCTDPNIEW